jgi:hypothetical protein
MTGFRLDLSLTRERRLDLNATVEVLSHSSRSPAVEQTARVRFGHQLLP